MAFNLLVQQSRGHVIIGACLEESARAHQGMVAPSRPDEGEGY